MSWQYFSRENFNSVSALSCFNVILNVLARLGSWQLFLPMSLPKKNCLDSNTDNTEAWKDTMSLPLVFPRYSEISVKKRQFCQFRLSACICHTAETFWQCIGLSAINGAQMIGSHCYIVKVWRHLLYIILLPVSDLRWGLHVITNHFSCPRRGVGRACESVCVCRQ